MLIAGNAARGNHRVAARPQNPRRAGILHMTHNDCKTSFNGQSVSVKVHPRSDHNYKHYESTCEPL